MDGTIFSARLKRKLKGIILTDMDPRNTVRELSKMVKRTTHLAVALGP